MKKTAMIMLILLLFVNGGCQKQIDPVIAYCTRAAVAVTNNMNSTAPSFTISYAEYMEEDGMKKVTLKCQYNHGPNNYSTHVFVVGEGGDFFSNAMEDERGVIDSKTGLYVIDYGDRAFIEQEENVVDIKVLYNNYSEYMKTKDSSLLGILD